MAQQERSFVSDLPRYFIHGLLYAILGTLATFVFTAISIASTLVVGIVAVAGGELVGYVVLSAFIIFLLLIVLFVAGLINAALARSLWGATPPASFKGYTGHGAALVIVLVIFGIPNMAIDWLFPGLDFLTFIFFAIPRIIVYAIIDGFIGRWVAYGFSDFPTASKTVASEDTVTGTCPQCGVDTISKFRGNVESKVVVCHGCGSPFEIPRQEE